MKTVLETIERLERKFDNLEKVRTPKSTAVAVVATSAAAAMDEPGSRELAGLLDPHLPVKKRKYVQQTSDNGNETPPPPPPPPAPATKKAKKPIVPCQRPTGDGNTCGKTDTPYQRFFCGLALCNACGLKVTRGAWQEFGTQHQKQKWANIDKSCYMSVRDLYIRNNPAVAGVAAANDAAAAAVAAAQAA